MELCMVRWGERRHTVMCSGSEAGSYLRLIDFVYHSTLDLRVIKKRRRSRHLDFKPAGEPRRTNQPSPVDLPARGLH